MTARTHTAFAGRAVRIPKSKAGYFSPAAGKVGTVTHAGWDDWYLVHVDGLYYCRAQAHEIEPSLIRYQCGDGTRFDTIEAAKAYTAEVARTRGVILAIEEAQG